MPEVATANKSTLSDFFAFLIVIVKLFAVPSPAEVLISLLHIILLFLKGITVSAPTSLYP